MDQSGTPGLDTLTDYDNYGVRAREIFRPWDGGDILVGLDIDYIGGEVQFRNPASPDRYFDRETFRLMAPYMAVSHQLGSREGFYAIPSAGFRYLTHSEFDNEIAPQAGLIIGYEDTEFHASYARGVN